MPPTIVILSAAKALVRHAAARLLAVPAVAVLGACAVPPPEPTAADINAVLKQSFQERSIARLDRLDQSELQAACSEAAWRGRELAPADRQRLEAAALASVRFPADGKFLGDWRSGERVAQSGVGLQWSDNAQTVNGGNCYACHQLTGEEIAFGNIGPSLRQYGKIRGTGEPMLRYTWSKIWNAHAFNACSQMPRYGDAGILTEAQLRDVMALLLDPASPVNR